MDTKILTSLVVQSTLSEGFATVIFQDPDGWEFSVTAFRGILAPTRVVLSRFFIRISGASNDLRDHDENLAEINELHHLCGLALMTNHYLIDTAIERYMNEAKVRVGTNVDDFRQVVFEVLDGIEWGSVVEVDAIPPHFSKTLPDRVTPRRFSLLVCGRAACPV